MSTSGTVLRESSPSSRGEGEGDFCLSLSLFKVIYLVL